MADDGDSFAIDALGNRVLIGLSADETEEFLGLDAVICETGPLLADSDDWYGPRERRWLALYEKHETARRRFLTSSKTVH
jgi:hypothetical protein